MPTYTTTPTGRIVWSSGNAPHERAPVMDDKTKQQRLGKDGQPLFEYGFGLAIPKAEFGPVWTAALAEASKIVNPPPAFDNNGIFAYKVIDGDGMDKGNLARGIAPQPYSKREGYGGCFVITVKSQLPNPPPVFVWGGTSWVQADPNALSGGNKLKTGDYVQVGLAIDGHLGQSPGLYLNPQGIQFVGFGTAIMRGPDAATMFGAGPAALPPGATAVPQAAPAGAAAPAMPAGLPAAAPAPLAPAGLPGMPQAATAPAAVPSVAPLAAPAPAPALPTASPSSVVPPATGFVAAAAGLPGMPAAAPAPAPAPAPAVPAGFPAGSVQTGFDANSGKAIWRWPDGNSYLAP